MEVVDGRGNHGRKIGEENRSRIKAYIEEHPDASKTQTAKDLGISRVTLDAHLKIINEEKV